MSIESTLLLLVIHAVSVINCRIEPTLTLALGHHHASWLICLYYTGPDVVKCIRLFALEEVRADLALTDLLLLLLSLNFQLLLLHRV